MDGLEVLVLCMFSYMKSMNSTIFLELGLLAIPEYFLLILYLLVYLDEDICMNVHLHLLMTLVLDVVCTDLVFSVFQCHLSLL